MNETWSALIGTLIGALAGIMGAWLSASWQGKSEHKRWLREQKRKAYSDALKALSAATIIPIGINLEEIAKWYFRLVEVRETLIVLQVYSASGQNHIAECSNNLFLAIDENNFASVATEAATLKETEDDISSFVLIGVANIRAKINNALSEVTTVAKSELGQLINI